MRETRQVFLIQSLLPGHQPPLRVKEQEFITGCSLLPPPLEVVPHPFLCAVPYTTHTHTHTHTHTLTHSHTHTLTHSHTHTLSHTHSSETKHSPAAPKLFGR